MAGPGNEPIAVDDAGNEFVVRNGGWVPKPSEVIAPESKTLGEMTGLAKAGGTGLIKGATDVAGLPGDVQSLVNAGLNKVMPASTAAEQPPRQPSQFEQTLNALRGGAELPTSQGIQKTIQKATGPFYEPQTGAEKVAQGAGEAVPFGMLGAGPMLPNMARAALAGGASEAAGQATEGGPFETPARIAAGLAAYGGSGAAYRPRINPTNATQAAAQRLEAQGVRVPASVISGSPTKAMLENAPMDMSGPVSEAMQRAGGVPIPPGNTSQYRQLLEHHYLNNLRPEADRLGTATSIPPPLVPPLRSQLGAIAHQHAIDFAGAERPEVADALNRFDTHLTENVLQGRPGITGRQYQRLHEEWSGSPVPEVRQMSGLVDAAMDQAHPNAWNNWRNNYANYQGLKAESERLGGAAVNTPFSPDTVAKSMYRNTPMRQIAEDAQTVKAAQPQPRDFSASKDLLKVLGGATGVAGAGFGYAHGGIPAAEAGGLLGFVPGMVSEAIPAGARLASPVFRTGGGQNFLRNMDPRMVAALLAQQGITPKGEPVQQPEGTTQ